MHEIRVRAEAKLMTGQRLKRDYGIEYGVLDTLVNFGIVEKNSDRIVPYCLFNLEEVRAGIVILGKLFEDQKDFIPADYKTLLSTQGGWEKFLTKVMRTVRFLKPEAAAKIVFECMSELLPFLIENDTEILLPGIGKLYSEVHGARKIYVPATNEHRYIAGRRIWKLRLKNSLKPKTKQEKIDG